MATLERQLQLEGRVVRILIAALLLTWLAGLLAVGPVMELRQQRDEARARIAAALWIAEDQRLAVRACYEARNYEGRAGAAWRKSVVHVVNTE